MSTTIPMNAPMHAPIIVPRGTDELLAEAVAASPTDEPEGMDEEEVEDWVGVRTMLESDTSGGADVTPPVRAAVLNWRGPVPVAAATVGPPFEIPSTCWRALCSGEMRMEGGGNETVCWQLGGKERRGVRSLEAER